MLFTNGKIPDSVVSVVLGTGTDENGYWEFRCTPAFAARWAYAKAYALQHFGRTIYIRTGWNIYRPLFSQQTARRNACAQGNCNGAAVPGSSSHGGNWNGQDCLAVDVDPNGLSWAQVDEAMIAAGFKAGLITAAISSFPNGEPWHYILFGDDAFGAIPAFASAFEFSPTPPIREDQEMYVCEWNGHILSFGLEAVKHETSYPHADLMRNITAADDKYIGLDNDGIIAVCETFGIPWYAVDAVLQGKALDYTTGAQTGHFWSRSLELKQSIDSLAKKTAAPFDPSSFSQTITETINSAIAAKPIAADIDAQDIRDIAKANADEQDRRARERLNG